MTPEHIKDAVENYSDFLSKREKLEKRMISVSGRDPEQEMLLLERLEQMETILEIIHNSDDYLETRENGAVMMRMDGIELKEMSEIFGYTRQSVGRILKNAYKKMAEAARAESTA